MKKISHLNDLIRIRNIFRLIDFNLDLDECFELWYTVAQAELNEAWMLLPESDTEILEMILKYFNFGSKLFDDTSKNVTPSQIRKYND